MKRSFSSSPSRSPSPSPNSYPTDEDVFNPSPKMKKAKATPKTPTTPKSTPKKGTSNSPQVNGTWTPEKRGEFIDEVIAAGYKSINLDGIALKLEMSKRQLIDQLVPNRQGNLRAKSVASAKATK